MWHADAVGTTDTLFGVIGNYDIRVCFSHEGGGNPQSLRLLRLPSGMGPPRASTGFAASGRLLGRIGEVPRGSASRPLASSLTTPCAGAAGAAIPVQLAPQPDRTALAAAPFTTLG